MSIPLILNNTLVSLYGHIFYVVYRFREKRRYHHYEFPYSPANGGKSIYILCTGPSLKDDLVKLRESEDFAKADKMCVNYFINNDLIKEIKPTYYCLADPAFFDFEKDDFKQVADGFNNNVDWEMTLFIPLYGVDKVAKAKKMITNKKIKIETVSIMTFRGFENNRYESWKKGISVPSYVNISIMAIYIALNMGFSKLYLYGVEHTFFDGMGVDDDNRLYLTDNHFYDSVKRYVSSSRGKRWGTKDWLYDKYLTFLEHERMRGYADYLGATIINCTRNSLIDAYTRIAQIEKQDNK